MNLNEYKETIPAYANDIKLNLSSVLLNTEELTDQQIAGVALACSYSLKQKDLIDVIFSEFANELDDSIVGAAKSASTIMAMNNVYYRFVHLVSDNEYSQMPAKLRMNIIANPGISKIDFEMYALAVSALNGCGMCMDSHVMQLHKAEVTKQAVQSIIRIASVLNAAANIY